MRKNLRRLMAPLAAVLLLAVWMQGCDKEAVPTPTAPTIQTPPTGLRAVIITVSHSEIPADGRSATLITATCTIGGQQAPDSLAVRFKTNNGKFSLDGITPITATNQKIYDLLLGAGRAQIYLISEEIPGSALVEALFGVDAVASAIVEFVRMASDVGSIELIISPTSGSSPLSVLAKATVKSRDGNVLFDVEVEFKSSDKTATVDKRVVKSDAQGLASTFIRSIVKDCTVTAKAGGFKAVQSVEVTNDTAKNLKLEGIDQNGVAKDSIILVNEQGSLLIRATVQDDTGAVKDIDVNFSSTDGNSYFTANPVKTNSKGEAETFLRNIRHDCTVTAEARRITDTLSVKINNPPVGIISVLSPGDWSPGKAGQVNVFVFSAEQSYDIDVPFGDKITSYRWTFTLNTSGTATVTPTSSTEKSLTVTVGSAAALPQVDDELTVVLRVEDSSGLTHTSVIVIKFE